MISEDHNIKAMTYLRQKNKSPNLNKDSTRQAVGKAIKYNFVSNGVGMQGSRKI
jgi:hypothetical protein